MVEDLMSDLDDPTKELYLGDHSNGTHCELSSQYPLNKLYLGGSVNKFCLDGSKYALGDSQCDTYLGNSTVLCWILTSSFYFIKPESFKRQNWKKRKKKLFVLGRRCRPFYFIKPESFKRHCSFWEEDADLSTSSNLKALKDRIYKWKSHFEKRHCVGRGLG